ncbi:MAG: vWA domain-containing protein [bacterium]
MRNTRLSPYSRVRIRNRRGAMLILFTLVLFVLLGVCALVIDLGVAYVAAGQLQNIADAAALAGAGKLREGLDLDAAKNEAISIAAANKVLGVSQTLPKVDVIVGSWDATSGKVIPLVETSGEYAIQVTVRRTQGSANGPISTFFAKIWGKDSIDVTRSAIAGLQVREQQRAPLKFMIVQDGSSSFQGAWSKAVEADGELLKLVNSVSLDGDAAGIVTFNAKLPDSYLPSNLYRTYPVMNKGIKYVTDKNGVPFKSNEQGASDPNGQYRSMAGGLTAFIPSNHSVLPLGLDNNSKLTVNGNAWGDTDTSAGLNYAIDQMISQPGSNASKVIVLVSDGMPHSVGGTSSTTAFKLAAIAAADRAKTAGIRIHTVTLEGTNGANFDFNEGLIRNGGAALRASSADDLKRLLIGVGTIEIGRPKLLK